MSINIDGIWDCTIAAPGGKEAIEFTLKSSEGGALTGSAVNHKDGIVNEIKEGRLDGNLLTGTMQLVKPFKLTLKLELEIDGTQLKGHANTAMLGKAAIVGNKRI